MTFTRRQPVIVQPGPSLNPVQFLGTDTGTGGAWNGVYGSAGYWTADSSAGTKVPPGSATLSLSGQTWFSGGPWDVAAAKPQLHGSSTTYASFWYSATTITMALTNGASAHTTVGVYMADDQAVNPRTQSVQWQDGSGNVLFAPVTVNLPNSGIYYRFLVSGSANLILTFVSGSAGNCMLALLVFD